MNEINNMYFNVIYAVMVRLVEVVTNRVLEVFATDVMHVALEPVHQSSLGLAYILQFAGFAGYTVY